MEHANTIEAHLPERYYLGELVPALRDEFEEHLADCRVCRQEVATVDLFAANAVGVFEDDLQRKAAGSRAKESGGWLDFLRLRSWPVLAFSGVLNCALLFFVAYGVTQNPGPRTGVAEVFAVRPPTRSADVQTFPVDKSKSFVVLQFDLPRRYQRYSWTLDGASQDLKSPVSATAETLALTVALTSLPVGDHRLRLTGWDGQQSFELGVCNLRVADAK
jgi:hypothetical protein